MLKVEFHQGLLLRCHSLPHIKGVRWRCVPFVAVAGRVEGEGRKGTLFDLGEGGGGEDSLEGNGGPGQHVQGAVHHSAKLPGQLVCVGQPEPVEGCLEGGRGND